jgi:nucleotide-binding universal stress UspA family protein
VSGAIICGVDDSTSAKGAARVARVLSRQLERPLVFMRVVEAGSTDEAIGEVVDRLERLSLHATDVDQGAGWLVDVGHPADRIVAAAAAADASLIVLGSTGPRSSLLGSISADVSRRAPCPVVVVPPGADTVTNARRAVSARPIVAAGLNRFDVGDGNPDFAGGIARFGFDDEA